MFEMICDMALAGAISWVIWLAWKAGAFGY